MNTKFPDELFEIKRIDQYANYVQRGFDVAKNSKILFCGIVRNVENTLPLNIKRINYTGQLFKKFKIFIYENNSVDNTVDILKLVENNLDFVSTNLNTDYMPDLKSGKDPVHYHRCCALALCRKEYHKYVVDNPDFDYVCVIDLDILGGWSYNGFLHGLGVLEDKEYNAAVTSYGILSDANNSRKLEEVDPRDYLMYDTFAFRPTNYECKSQADLCIFNYIRPNVGGSPIILESNFNGLAIYKTHYFLKGEYRSELVNEKLANCEHIPFHRDIISSGGRIIMDPSMLVSYSSHKYSI